MISAQTLRVCREGKPVSTFSDHALSRLGSRSPGRARAGEAAIKRLIRHGLTQDRAHRDQPVDVDAGGKTLALAEEHQVLELDIAGRARRERATTEAAERAVEDTCALVERSRRVGDAHAAGVVQVN